MATIGDMMRGGMNDEGIAKVTGLPVSYIAGMRARRVNRSEAATVAMLADTARAPKLATVDPAALKRARAAIRRARFGRAYYAIGGILGAVLAIMAAPLALFVTADHGPYAGAAVAIGTLILAGNIARNRDQQ